MHSPKITITGYQEPVWAELKDVIEISPEVSLNILEGIHLRIIAILKDLIPGELQRKFHHPEAGDLTIEEYIHSLANHGISHLKGIKRLLE